MKAVFPAFQAERLSFFLHSYEAYDIIKKLDLCQAPNPSAGRVICPKEEVIS